jgi:4-hydroxy-4-methyl-2-oxoglutarate aldolase
VAGVVVRRVERPELRVLDEFAQYGVATIHEAQGRTGLLAPSITPIYPGAHIAGSAVTVSAPPQDNLIVHVAIELCQEGDVLVLSPTAPNDGAYLGELIATALQVRGVRGFVVDAGARDVAELRAMSFPVWARCVSALGPLKEALGDVNVPIECAGRRVEPGDVVVADDDGVVVVPRANAAAVLEASRARAEKEVESRKRYAAGDLSLDIQGLRATAEAKGLRYVD